VKEERENLQGRRRRVAVRNETGVVSMGGAISFSVFVGRWIHSGTKGSGEFGSLGDGIGR
jgi:hypothetical protein